MTPTVIYNKLEDRIIKDFADRPAILKDVMRCIRDVLNPIDVDYKNLRWHYSTLEQVFKSLCEILNVEPEEVLKPRRKRHNVVIRQFYCFIAKDIFASKYSLHSIGKTLGNKDHTTVLYSIQTAQGLLTAKDPDMLEIYSKWELAHAHITKPEKQPEIIQAS